MSKVGRITPKAGHLSIEAPESSPGIYIMGKKAFVHVYKCISIYGCMHECIYLHIYGCMHVFVYVYIFMYVCMVVCIPV